MQFRYSLDYCKIPAGATCTAKETEWEHYGFWDMAFLDRHIMACDSDEEYLTGFVLRYDGDIKARFEYTCCRD